VKLNRERITTLLALLLVLAGLKSVVIGFVTPARGIRVPDVTITRSSREVIPRRYRTFTAETEISRNPFSFSEGWQSMETMPLALPSLPPAPHPVPFLGAGPTPSEWGFVYQDRPPEEIKESEEAK